MGVRVDGKDGGLGDRQHHHILGLGNSYGFVQHVTDVPGHDSLANLGESSTLQEDTIPMDLDIPSSHLIDDHNGQQDTKMQDADIWDADLRDICMPDIDMHENVASEASVEATCIASSLHNIQNSVQEIQSGAQRTHKWALEAKNGVQEISNRLDKLENISQENRSSIYNFQILIGSSKSY
ncbi:hypothetical protein MGYG_05320 [Nannizzia gypsea CBS 118893]|uniref:Uncharacterized protein n=1 Tax=Arthroderma gypseum (strain ATCC MYA-4604 / CBS 118893) TaxID=535722 RepID=E4UVJ6_ARTGP|nr:hypothetical protein MGYG_05320 [Nannizzia gypsea CBS 118893]EFR02323.1 hypothetical protein MGYG_05320 [Nannizzia gypsea CBS 118893]